MLKLISNTDNPQNYFKQKNAEITDKISGQRTIIYSLPQLIYHGGISNDFIQKKGSEQGLYVLPDITKIIEDFYLTDSNYFQKDEFEAVNLAISMGFGEINKSRFNYGHS